MNSHQQTQKILRKAKRHLRQSIPQENKNQYAIQAAEKMIKIPEYQQASNIACYLCMPEEISTMPIIRQAWKDEKVVYLPVVIALGTPLLWAKYTVSSQLSRDILDIEIPNINPDNYITANELDFVVTPLVSFDEQRNRIGMGGGFYDRTFEYIKQGSSKTFLAGIAFESQKTKQIIANDWDVKPHAIITETTIYSS